MQDPGDASTSREPHFLRRRVDEVVLVLQVDGELDIGSTDALRSALDAAEREGDIVRIDAAGVSFLDSTALGVLLASAQRLSARGGRLELINVSPAVRRILDMTLIARTVHVIS
jgi:anti-sigma B factor antagonist